MYPRDQCGRTWFYFHLQSSITTRASVRIHNSSRFRHSSFSRALKLSMYPFSQTPFDKLRTVVASDVFRGSVFIDQLRKDLLHFTGVDLPIHMDTQALPGILIDDVEHSQFASSPRCVMNKIPRPHMPTVLALGRKARRYPLSPALGLFRRHRQHQGSRRSL
jgi:hypothetical protein